MKFGQNLYRNVVPEWQASYIDYKGLKKRIKKQVLAVQEGKDADLAPFIFSLDRELEKVDQFYNKRLADSTRKLKILGERHKEQFDDPKDIPRLDLEEHMEVLLEIRGQLRKIAWFGDVNRRGFVKILKKLDKKLNVKVQQRYLNSKVLIKPFASPSEVTSAERTVNEWLEKLGGGIDLKDKDQKNDSNSLSLKNSSAGGVSGLSKEVLETFDISIKEDDAPKLEAALNDLYLSNDQFSRSLILNLLQRAIYARSFKSAGLLLNRTDTLKDHEDINERNLLHRLVITLGRSTSTKIRNRLANYSDVSTSFYRGDIAAMLAESAEEKDQLPVSFEGIYQAIAFLLANMTPILQIALTDRDAYGRIPLHYAAEYGIVQACQILTEYMQKWGQIDQNASIDSSPWWDNEGLAPLHLAVIGQHPKTTKVLLDAEKLEVDRQEMAEVRRSVSKSSAVLCLATRNNAPRLVELLVKAEVDVNFADEFNESALFIAAKMGHLECAKILLTQPEAQKVDIEFTEPNFGWTPLFTAAVHGHEDLVSLLLQSGADAEKLDSSGWSVAEHSTLRGHLKITRMIFDQTQHSDTASTISDTASTVQPGTSSLSTSPARSLIEGGTSPMDKAKLVQPNTKPIKTFGHRYLKDQTMILVTLGSKDIRTQVDPVKLDQIPIAYAHSTQLDTALSLVVSAKGAEGDETIIDLPLQDSIETETIAFETRDLSKVKLVFDIVPTYSGRNDKILGRAVAVLNSLRPENAGGKSAFQGGHTIPILEVSTLEVIGSVNFEFLIITPFTHPNMSVTKEHTYWKTLTVPTLIGHRGLGKNISERKSLQLGENTLQSFISAANLGAKYVEFDVQLTKDHVPVLYHDFLVSETGIDVPVHSLTLEQFLHINEQANQPSRPGSPPTTERIGENKKSKRFRSLSVGSLSDDRTSDLLEKMKYTRAWKMKGFNANTRGSQIHGPVQTLEGVFRNLPMDIGFNIELKYPMLDEAQAEDMDNLGIELNAWLDKILKIVYDHGDGRDIIFSSFHPDICLMVSFKQPSIPVLFLTEGGTQPMSDVRASSLKEAIKFASSWNLLGIVTAAEPLVRCPRLIRVVKETGLVCVSYGSLNNDTENVRIQAGQGIDAVIVDNVLAIRKGLTALKDGVTESLGTGSKDVPKDEAVVKA